jgi:DNA (cytosine-5)-methyltransferase 1
MTARLIDLIGGGTDVLTGASLPDGRLVLDLYGGPGGWDVALEQLGFAGRIGVESEENACATRIAAGHDTIRADVSLLNAALFAGRLLGLIASPPCQTFSAAGRRGAARLTEILRQLIRDLLAGNDTREQYLAEMRALLLASDWASDVKEEERPARIEAAVASAAQVAEPARFIAACMPEWICFEQVPAALPLWREYARLLRKMGYFACAGKINCADYGVPQTRVRAVLIASRTRPVALPVPTHYDPRKGPRLDGRDWVSMARALGWGMNDRPYFTLATAGGSRGGADEQVGGSGARRALYGEMIAGRWVLKLDNQVNATHRSLDEPAPTIKAGHSIAEMEWVLLTNRDQRADGTRQQIDPFGSPAPAFTGKSGGQWVIKGMINNNNDNACFREPDEPAGTIFYGARLNTGVDWVIAPGDWELHRERGAGMIERDGGRRDHPLTEPAPTLTAGTHGSGPRMTWVRKPPAWTDERPATTVQGDPRIGRPGHKDREGGESQFAVESIRLTPDEAAVLQGFDWGYPWQGVPTRVFQQCGNAFPPPAAAAVVGAATGIDWAAALARHHAARVHRIAGLVADAQQAHAEGGEAA